MSHVSPHLNEAALPNFPPTIARPAYERSGTRIGLVHLGVGAFHRAHQAVYIDDLPAEDPHWAICGVSLHSAEVRDALRPQDGLCTLALLGEAPRLRVIGSIRELPCARPTGGGAGAAVRPRGAHRHADDHRERAKRRDRSSRRRPASAPETRHRAVHRAQPQAARSLACRDHARWRSRPAYTYLPTALPLRSWRTERVARTCL